MLQHLGSRGGRAALAASLAVAMACHGGDRLRREVYAVLPAHTKRGTVDIPGPAGQRPSSAAPAQRTPEAAPAPGSSPPPPLPPPGRGEAWMAGRALRVTPTTLELRTDQGTVALRLDDKTVVHRRDVRYLPEDVPAGARIDVRVPQGAQGGAADEIELLDPIRAPQGHT
jgi:hypothetical protein